MDTKMLIWMKLHLTSGFMIGKTRLKYRPVQVSVSRYKIMYLVSVSRYKAQYLDLDTRYSI